MLRNRLVGFATIVFIGCGTTTAPDGLVADGTAVSNDGALSTLKSGNAHKGVCDPTAKLHCHARIRTNSDGSIMRFAAAAPAGLGPADFKSAYALDTSRTPNATIAIVDAFGYPNAEADLAVYRSTYGLPACTVASGCLKIVNQDGAASPLPPAPASNDDWTVETALDLDMASAACPNCKLLLVEANSDQDDGLFIAQDTAVRLGASVISDSWGGSGTGVDAYEHYFNHPGVGIFVASGDTGYNNAGKGPDYPSTSAFVIAVGGTALTKSASTSRGWSEKAWGPRSIFGGGAGGSSCSTEVAKPSFQAGLKTSCTMRAASDVAAVGDPATGPAVYNRGPSSTGWVTVGGTSASSPLVAGIYALTGRSSASNSFAYSNAKAFNDVTTGKNDSCGNTLCNAGAGWDGPTGIGTPNGAAMVQTNCTPSCGSHICGDDGCGGSCGTCVAGSTCSGGTCNVCTPSCGSNTCGSDGCGGSCGSCASGTSCTNGTCTGGTTTDGGTGGGCHDVCTVGAAESPSCGTCATLICAFDAACCTSSWDATCVLASTFLCRCKN